MQMETTLLEGRSKDGVYRIHLSSSSSYAKALVALLGVRLPLKLGILGLNIAHLKLHVIFVTCFNLPNNKLDAKFGVFVNLVKSAMLRNCHFSSFYYLFSSFN